MLGVLGAGAGIFDEHEGKAQAGSLTCGGLDASISGDACEDDRVDPAGFELLLQVSAGEGAPMPLGDEDVASKLLAASVVISTRKIVLTSVGTLRSMG